MPTQTIWVNPELFLKYRRVSVFHTYRYNDIEQRRDRHVFTLKAECEVEHPGCSDDPCRHLFDVRTLSTWNPPVEPPYCTGKNNTPENRAAWDKYGELEVEAMRTAMMDAIEKGELRRSGLFPSAGPKRPRKRARFRDANFRLASA